MSLFIGRSVVAALLASVLAGPALAATEPLPQGVTARQTGAGVFFADAKGMALYTYAQDKPGKSVCNAECAKNWPPLAAGADAKPTGEWSVIKRDDGSSQWALRDKPVYTYIRDSYTEGALGDRVGNAWYTAFTPIATPPGIAVRATYVGRLLTDARGHTLYVRDDEKPEGKAVCIDACLETWIALRAPLMANKVGDLAPVQREDGSLQWAYQGRRLYWNTNEIKPAQLLGDGADKVWRAVILEPAPALPNWVTVQSSDMGEIYANDKGLTLYTFGGSLDKVKQTMCDDACLAKNWKTIPVDANAKPTGDWTILTDGGAPRWAYKGVTLYTHTRDKEPGAIGGDKWAAGAGGFGGVWAPIVRRRDYEEQ